MFKKLLIVGAFALAAMASIQAQASTGYYFVSVCMVPNAFECPNGPNPVTFGPYSTYAACMSARAVWATGPLGTYPRSLSGCYLN